jgi:hypothetical protein
MGERGSMDGHGVETYGGEQPHLMKITMLEYERKL